jgi:shikimate kinase
MADSVFLIELTVVANKVQESTQQARDAIQSIADEAKATTEKAKASLSLLSEEFGVKMPGEIQSLIAQIPAVGAALKAAFSATVVIAIIQVLVEIAEKIEALRNKAKRGLASRPRWMRPRKKPSVP